MSEIKTAIYHKEAYYLLPLGMLSFEEFVNSIIKIPLHIKLRKLSEDNGVSFGYQKGVCIAPYFYNEYGYLEEEVVIEDLSDIIAVEIELLTQEEYNERIRKIILNYCPGCHRYKPLTNRVSSLSGHYQEISLNSVCFYRQNCKPSPRVFTSNLRFLGGLWKHSNPEKKNSDDIIENIKSWLYLKCDVVENNLLDSNHPSLKVNKQSTLISQLLLEAFEEYIEKHLSFTKFRLDFPRLENIKKDDVLNLISEKNRDVLQKEFKKYGVGIAKLEFDLKFLNKIKRSLDEILYHDLAKIITLDNGEIYFLVLDIPGFKKALHYRTPLMELADAKLTVYDQYEVKKYKVCFDMCEEK